MCGVANGAKPTMLVANGVRENMGTVTTRIIVEFVLIDHERGAKKAI